MVNKNLSGLLKISQVAEASETSITTVKYYVKEGLVDIACKTGKNMAYYAPESVERVKFIKALQTEKYYPLSVIKRIIRSGGADAAEVELFDTINKGDQSDYYETLPITDAAQQAGLKQKELQSLIASGLIVPIKNAKNKLCSHGDLRLMKLVKRRMDAGIPIEQTIKSFSMYEQHLRETARLDIRSLVKDGMLSKDLSTEDIVSIINISDETLDSFISMKRYALNAAMGEEYIIRTEKMFPRFASFAEGLCQLLSDNGYFKASDLLRSAINGTKVSDPVISGYCELLKLKGMGIAYTLSVLHKTDLVLKNPPKSSDDIGIYMTHEALRLGFIALAPEELGYDFPCELEKARERTFGKNFLSNVLQLLTELQSEKI